VSFFDLTRSRMQRDAETIAASVRLAQAEHFEWADRIWAVLDEATNALWHAPPAREENV